MSVLRLGRLRVRRHVRPLVLVLLVLGLMAPAGAVVVRTSPSTGAGPTEAAVGVSSGAVSARQGAKPRKSRVSLAYDGARFTGKVRPRACAAGRKIVVKQAGAGKVGKARTNRKGRFAVASGPRSGRFTVVAKPGKGCAKAKASLEIAAPVSVGETPPDVRVPGPPTEVVAVPGDARATVSWKAPGEDGGAPITGYTVTALPGGATATAAAGQVSVVVTGLTNGTPYTFTVVATNRVGDSPASAVAGPVTPVAPGPVERQVAVVAIRSAGVVLRPGETAELAVEATDQFGDPIAVDPAEVVWASADPDIVDVDGSGLATGIALGATSLTATVDGVSSPDSLALVFDPAEDAVLVNDAQFAGPPVFDVEPGEEPDFDTPVVVELTGLTDGPPAVGALLSSTESIPVAGRVVSVEDLGEGRFRVVLEQVSMREALGEDFDIDGDLDLSGAEFEVDEVLEEFYEVTRDGDTLTFEPKPDVVDDGAARASGRRASGRAVQRSLSAGPCTRKGGDPAGPLECSFLKDKLSCEISGTGITNTPFRLVAPPAFTVELAPRLDTTEQGDETFRWVFSAHPKVTTTVSLALEASVEFKAECKMQLAQPKIPAPGLAGVFLAGIFPVGVGFEANPKLTLSDFRLGVTAVIGGQTTLGLTCRDVETDEGFEEDCDVLADFTFDDPVFEPIWETPTLDDARLKLAFQAFAFADVKIGPPTVPDAQAEIGGFKLGPSAEADLATRTAQINTADYASSIKATLPLSLSIGKKLGRIARLLGVGEIKFIDQPLVEADLDITPTGELAGETLEDDPDLDDGDPATMDTGDRVRFTGTLANPAGFNAKFDDPTTFLGLSAFGIDEVMLVDKFGEIIATQPGIEGRTEYTFDLDVVSADNTTNGPGKIKFGRFADTYLFIKTDLPLDLLGLEIAQATVEEPVATFPEALYYLEQKTDAETGASRMHLMGVPTRGVDPAEVDFSEAGEVALPGILGNVGSFDITADGRYVAVRTDHDDGTGTGTHWILNRETGDLRQLAGQKCASLDLAADGSVGVHGIFVDDACTLMVFPVAAPPTPDEVGNTDCSDTTVPEGTGPDCAVPFRGELPTAAVAALGSSYFLSASGTDLIGPDPGSVELLAQRAPTDAAPRVIAEATESETCVGGTFCDEVHGHSRNGPLSFRPTPLNQTDGVISLMEERSTETRRPGEDRIDHEVDRRLRLARVGTDGTLTPLSLGEFSCSAINSNLTVDDDDAFGECMDATTHEERWHYLVSPDDQRMLAIGEDPILGDFAVATVSASPVNRARTEDGRGLWGGQVLARFPFAYNFRWAGLDAP